MHALEPEASKPDPIGLTWLVLVRWTSILAGAGAVVAARTALEIGLAVAPFGALFSIWVASNLWLAWQVRRNKASLVLAGTLVLADVLVLTGLLHVAGGILNPAAVFYLVQIVMSALVLGRLWTWMVTAIAVAGCASLYLVPTAELSAAVTMHREIGLHMRGMWLAFALTALIIAVLVTRLAMAVERRDRALVDLRERSARSTRAAGLATLAAGAAHELGTPLSTIAVAARELERRLESTSLDPDLLEDARLIRAETDRCRRVLEAMAAESGQSMGETPRATTMSGVMDALCERLSSAERARLDLDVPADVPLLWPVGVVARSLCNVVQNGIQASPTDGRVTLHATAPSAGSVTIRIVDRGQGMTDSELARAGEPFFTTKPVGKGTGLGLFVARSTVEQLGGALSIATSRGQGTTVTIVLPMDVVASETRRDA